MRINCLQRKKHRYISILLGIFLLLICMGTIQVEAADYLAAPTLAVNSTWSSEYYLTEEDDVQYFKIVIPSDGKLTYKVMGYALIGFKLYDEDLSTEINVSDVSGSELSPETKAKDVILSKGTYYLKVYLTYSPSGKFKVNTTFTSYNTNDANAISYDSPQTLSLSSLITGALTFTNIDDWYRINISDKGFYQYKVSSYDASVVCIVYNEDLSKELHQSSVVAGSDVSPDTYTRDLELAEGVYYLKICSWADRYSLGKYTLSVSPVSQSNCIHDYNITTISPTSSSQGYTLHKCQKCGYSYKDNYQEALNYRCVHSYRTTVIPSDYIKKGYSFHQCSQCGYSYTDNYKEKLVLGVPRFYYVSAGRKRVAISWSPVSAASGYQISYKTKGYSKMIKVKGGYSNAKKTIKKLKPKKKYSFRIRAYKKVSGKIVYGKWSSKKSVKIL